MADSWYLLLPKMKGNPSFPQADLSRNTRKLMNSVVLQLKHYLVEIV